MRAQRCKDKEGACFARHDGYCTILRECPYECRFKKPEREVTNRVYYPYIDPQNYERNMDD